jgi:hypothetical protein
MTGIKHIENSFFKTKSNAMAIADVGFSGRIANLIYYKMRGKTYVRVAPSRVRQTKATKAKATVFGRASGMGKSIREQLFPVIPFPSDHKMQIRLVSAVVQWLNMGGAKATDLSIIKEFDFIEKYRKVRNRWKASIKISIPSPGLVEIKIPALLPEEAIESPTGAVSVVCRIATGVCDVETGSALGSSSAELIFEYNNTKVDAQTISMKLPTPKGSLIVTGMSLTYKIHKRGYEVDYSVKSFMPAGIVDAKYV